ncbi:hypothetical protein [Demequina activiva]|uniref:Integral membrane protein n=1 Tax=Demequina activiva TaxID=1582364 RepID=A0A919Q3C1_9MICO|nr:hypothetical protein [Demequina activiva]GIG55507.1 hypothetical protein Dac01nite_22590 [Demequina activiva]
MNPIGRILLIVAYAVLGLAATGRSVVQISTRLSEAPLPYLLSGASAILYVLIAIALWRGWRRVAIVGTTVELVGVIVVGALGYLAPDLWPDETVWTGFGSAYGWVPLALPVIALVVLVRGSRASAVVDASGGA